MPIRWILVALPLLALSPAALAAQLVAGRALEQGLDTPVRDAEIVLVDARGRDRVRVVTDSAGAFVIAAPGAGAYTLRVRHVAYTPFRSPELRLGRGEVVELEVRLSAGAIPLEPLVVTARSAPLGRLAGFRERVETNAFGQFVTREELDRRPAANTTDLLRTMRGVTIERRVDRDRPFGPERNLIAMRGGAAGAGSYCEPLLFVDGVRIRQSLNSTMDDVLNPDLLEGVEVYSSAANAPVQYQQTSQCGVVLFWTREPARGGDWNWKRIALGVAGIAALLIVGF